MASLNLLTSLKRLLNIASRGSRWILPFMAIGMVIPFLILAGFGAVALVQQGYSLEFLALITGCTLLVYGVFWLWARQHKTDFKLETDAALVTASADWSEFDTEVWQKLNQGITDQLTAPLAWDGLLDRGLELMQQTAQLYGKPAYGFSVPESLKLIEEISRRYRILLRDNVPMIEKLTIGHFKYGFEQKENLAKGSKVYRYASYFYRVLRLVNPVSAVVAEVRKVVFDEFVKRIGAESQLRLKRALMQEVVSVSIDLYSGRFSVDDADLGTSQAALADQQRPVLELEPLRVGLVGQVSAGKSSLVNALTLDLAAEVDLLPTTQEARVYSCRIEGHDALHLIDLPGLDGQTKTTEVLVEEIQQCDLIIWVLKASQSSRQLDLDFQRALSAYYQADKQRSRKRPPILAVLNQVDLLNPVEHWQPPYDLTQPDSPKAEIINEALAYNRELLGFANLLPLSVSAQRAHFNLPAVQQQLDHYYSQGLQTQLNRRRQEGQGSVNLGEQWLRLGRAGKSLFRVMAKTGTGEVGRRKGGGQ